jgi:hypothetical protein
MTWGDRKRERERERRGIKKFQERVSEIVGHMKHMCLIDGCCFSTQPRVNANFDIHGNQN